MQKDEEDPFKYPKRALTVASVALTLIFVAFIATLLVSVFQIRLDAGQTRVAYGEGTITIFFPINITNAGYYDINNFVIKTVAFDENGSLFSSTSTVPVIRSGNCVSFEHAVPVNLTDFFVTHSSYLFNDAAFEMNEHVDLTVGGLIPVSLEITHQASWGAPLSGFEITAPTITPINDTHVQVSCSVHFSNNAQFPVDGSIVLKAYAGAQLLSTATCSVSADPGAHFDANLTLSMPVSPAPTRFTVELQTQYFSTEVPVGG